MLAAPAGRRLGPTSDVLQHSVVSCCNAIDLARQEYNVTGGKPSHRDLPRLYWCAPIGRLPDPTDALHGLAVQNARVTCSRRSRPADGLPFGVAALHCLLPQANRGQRGRVRHPAGLRQAGLPRRRWATLPRCCARTASPTVRWWCAVQSIARKRPPSPSLPAQRCAGRVFRVPDRIARVRGCGGLIVRAL